MITAGEMHESHRTQMYYVNTAVVQKTLRQTTVLALQVFDKLITRSTQLDDTEQRGTELMHQSEQFAAQAEQWNRPWWKRLMYWCCTIQCNPSTVKQRKCRTKRVS